jgi:hypothetical protein
MTSMSSMSSSIVTRLRRRFGRRRRTATTVTPIALRPVPLDADGSRQRHPSGQPRLFEPDPYAVNDHPMMPCTARRDDLAGAELTVEFCDPQRDTRPRADMSVCTCDVYPPPICGRRGCHFRRGCHVCG